MAGRTPEQMAEYVCFWIKRHPDKLKKIMHLIHMEVDGGNPCVQRGDVFNLARASGMEVSEIEEIKRDNTLWAGIARYAVMLSPRLARALGFRKSKLDEVDLVDAWYRHVGTYPLFYARDRFEAERLVEIDDATARR